MDLLRPNSIRSAKSLLASYSIDEVRLQLKMINLDYLNIDAISDRHLIIWGIMK
jgi:hypothetical protein